MIIWNNQHHLHQPIQPAPLLPPPSLSPPPRQIKSKRDSYNNFTSTATTTSRRPLIDPTLTPRVKPLSIKTKKQPSLLRLSLDAELLQSPDGDNDSFITFKTGHSTSNVSITPTITTVPFRSGTLGATNNPRSSSNAMQPPPLPPPLNIPLDSTSSISQPHSQITAITTIDSPISTSDDDEQKLTLIERRRRRSPLSMPKSDQLTLALEEMLIEEQQQTQQTQQPQPQPRQDATLWRQQLLEQTIAYSLNNQSRQDAMLTLEGKKVRAISLQPIAHIRELDDHFEQKTGSDIVKDKAQYEAIVARTTMHRRQLSYEDKRQSRTSLRARSSPIATIELEPKQPQPQPQPQQPQQQQQQNQLGIITENEVATCRTPITASNKFSVVNNTLSNITPETPPYHKQTAPSLISAPSTPNSIDSSVIEHDDYISHQKHQMSLFLSSSTSTTNASN